MKTTTTEKAIKGTAWMSGLFYALIAFEFFYMASPFAVYFYLGYSPWLDLINRIPWASWLTGFYLPHFADTSSVLVNVAPIVGWVLTSIGLAGFLIGAFQIYSRKLLKRGAATGGIYRLVRHPQYASLILAGSGMLLLWPRFLMVALFVVMLFVYRALAWIEERECIEKFGQSYMDYLERTPRFLPLRLPAKGYCFGPAKSRIAQIGRIACSSATALLLAFGIAFSVQAASLGHLFVHATENAVYVALTPVKIDEIQQVASAAQADPRVRAHLAGGASENRYINYVMPWEWLIPEISVKDADDHDTPNDYKPHRFKIVYTKAVLHRDVDVQRREILRNASRSEPVLEVWIDEEGRVADVQAPPNQAFYGTVPVPVY